MSDLQCAATLVVVGPHEVGAPQESPASSVPSGPTGPTAPRGSPQGAPLWPARQDSIPTLVYAAPARRAQAAAIAEWYGCGERLEPDLAADEPAGLAAALEGLADLHRGECVLVLPAQAPPGCASTGITRLAIDADGWARA